MIAFIVRNVIASGLRTYEKDQQLYQRSVASCYVVIDCICSRLGLDALMIFKGGRDMA